MRGKRTPFNVAISRDEGETWELVNAERRIRQRAFYYTHVFADHQDPDVVYVQNTGLYRSDDGGETYSSIGRGTHGDHHDFWIDPDNPAHLIVGNDGGGAVSGFRRAARAEPPGGAAPRTPRDICGSMEARGVRP